MSALACARHGCRTRRTARRCRRAGARGGRLLDDVAAGAGRASVKAAGVIVDDAAVTPRYVQGFKADRELPMIKRIARGSLRNKLLFILPAALVISELLDWLLTPILMIGGAYLCYEGAEKIWEKIGPHHHGGEATAASRGPSRRSARRRRDPHGLHPLRGDHGDLAQRGGRRAARLPRADPDRRRVRDHRARLRRGRADREDGRHRPAAGRDRQGAAATIGRGLVRAMPIVMSVLSTVGIAAMLWVGGHILLVGLDDIGVYLLYDKVHDLEQEVDHELGASAAWRLADEHRRVGDAGDHRGRGDRGGAAQSPPVTRAPP